MLQILQLVPGSQGDQFYAWVVSEGIMLKIPVTVPRVFYINSKAPIEKIFNKISEEIPPVKDVKKALPHGRRIYNLYEVLLVAKMWFFTCFLLRFNICFFPYEY